MPTLTKPYPVLTIMKISVQVGDTRMNSIHSQNFATNINVFKYLGIRKTFPGP